MDGVFYAALVAAILVFAWSFVRIATLADHRPASRGRDDWYVVDAAESALCGATGGQGRPTIVGVPMAPRVVGASSYDAATSRAAFSGGVWQAPRDPDRPVLWVVPGRTATPGHLQGELARLKREGAIRNYYRVVAYPGGGVDYRA